MTDDSDPRHPDSVERAAFNTHVLGLHRRFTQAAADYADRFAADMARIDRALTALETPPDEARHVEDHAWFSVWLHGNWRWLTQNMTTEERELVASAVERVWVAMESEDPTLTHDASAEDLRWWR